MTAASNAVSAPAQARVAVPYWPAHAAKVATTSGLLSLAFLGIRMHVRSPTPATMLRGAVAANDAYQMPSASDAEAGFDMNFFVLMLCFAGLGTVTAFTQNGKGVPYWPLRAAKVAATSGLMVLVFLGILTHVRTAPRPTLLRGAVAAATTGNQQGSGSSAAESVDLNFVVMMLLITAGLSGLGAVCLFTKMFSKVRANGVPYWPLRAACLASASTFFSLVFLGLLARLRTAPPAALLRGAVNQAVTPDAPVLTAAAGGGGLNLARLVLQCVFAVIAIYAFGAQVYAQASAMLKLRDGLHDGPKKCNKKH